MKLVLRILGIVLLLVLLAVAALYAHLQRSLPTLDGELRLQGIAAEVEVLRDKDGIPHVFAATERDGWFAVGFLHAQDRLWQMEFQRRFAQGRLAEILGARAFESDRLMRTVGFAHTAERITARLDAATVANLEAYAAGVNAFLAQDPVLPVEFLVFGVEPEPWKPANSVAWLLTMSWDLSGNWRSELGRMRLAAQLGRERASQFLPPYPGDAPWLLPESLPVHAEIAPLAGRLLALSPQPEHAIGSNNWVVSGAHSVTGKPLLANDPHLGLQVPALWYLVHVSTPQGNVVGGTLPGLPFVVLGRNDHVAWAFTTTNSDTQDLFVERVASDDPSSYVTPAGREKFVLREERIRVGGEVRTHTVRTTRHGPVLSDAVRAMQPVVKEGHAISLAWAAMDEANATARAGFALNRARNRDELVAALRDFHAPHQNVVFADREGHIGFVAPSRVPLRRADNEAMGRVPVPGWDARYDWQGFLAFEALPAIHDPPGGKIVTANHKITPPGYKPFLSVDWFPPYRAERIEALLAATPKHSLESFARMQGDSRSRLAHELLPVALAARPQTPEGREAQALLAGWEGDMAADSAAPLVFTAWYRELTRLVYGDELGPMFRDAWELRAPFMIAVMKGAPGYEAWCRRTGDAERPATCALLNAEAFDLAARDLGKRFGPRESWRWGDAHRAANDHRPFGFFPFVSRWFNVAPRTPGDSYSVNVGSITIRDEARPFANRHAGSLRAIYDLADLDRSLFIQATGQSGNVLSPWYDNLAERWARVEYLTIPTKRESISAAHRLRLYP